MVLFAPHNIIKDAPFTKLDLITCRNLLIYLQPQFQKKALSLFHFGLKRGGLLFLGPSETPGALKTEFDVLNEHCKIYQKSRDIRLPADLRLSMPGGIIGPKPAPFSNPGIATQDSSLLDTYDRLLDRFMPPALLVAENHQLIDSFGGAEKFLQFKSRRPSNDILDLLTVSPKAAVAGSLRRAFKERKAVHFSGVSSDDENDPQNYRLSVEPIRNAKSQILNFLILFEQLDETAAASP
jgi:two-component system CheB/CheR fusion protein